MRSDIPKLPGHAARFVAYLAASFILFASGGFIAWIGENSDDARFLVSSGIAIAAVGFLGFGLCYRFAERAKCPRCKTWMEQGWDQKEDGLNGVFECPACHGQWKTSALWRRGD